MEDQEYVYVEFRGNGSKRWDGKRSEVPRTTLTTTGRFSADSKEEAKVHWPAKGGKGNGGKVWHCILVSEEVEEYLEPMPKRRQTSLVVSPAVSPQTQGIVPTHIHADMHVVLVRTLLAAIALIKAYL